MAEELNIRLYTFLQRHNVLTLAYNDRDEPSACALWFAIDQKLHFFFLSSLSTRHSGALTIGGRVAFTIQKDEQEWCSIQGVQGRGYCTLVPPQEHQVAWEIYTERYPFIKQQFPAIEEAMSRTKLWTIRPTWLRLIDNSQTFGHKEELMLEGDAPKINER